MRALLQRAGDQDRIAGENKRLRLELAQRGVLGDLVGESPQMIHIFALIRQVARAIHSFSPRGTEPFLAINCAALP